MKHMVLYILAWCVQMISEWEVFSSFENFKGKNVNCFKNSNNLIRSLIALCVILFVESIIQDIVG